MPKPVSFLLALALLFLCPCGSEAGEHDHPSDARRGGPPGGPRGGPAAGRGRDTLQDRVGGMPREILDQQSRERVQVPTLDDACRQALAAAGEVARTLIDTAYHTGTRLKVPEDFPTIQAAIDAASPRDVVVVTGGTYYELVRMKDGVKLISDASRGGDEMVEIEGARVKLPRRALRTILDGSKAEASNHGMIDFDPGTGRHTIVDGFTLQNLPKQNHHQPGHAHGINVRGSSSVIMHCLIQNNGSTGIGNHVVYKDQGSPIGRRDFRYANIEHRAAGVIYHNIIRGNLGLGIGCNHFSAPHILGNEVYENDDSSLAGEHADEVGPGLGAKHGAAPITVGNLVHHNPGGGILCREGKKQGMAAIDRVTHPTVRCNVVWMNGKNRAAISANGAGSEKTPVVFEGNWVFDAPLVGIGLSEGAFGIVEDNLVARSALPGIAIHGATALRLNRNKVTGASAPGFMIVGGARVLEMKDNAADANKGPRFMLRGGSITPRDDRE